MPRILLTLLTACCALGGTPGAAQQQPAPDAGFAPLSARDSARLLREARAEQSRFERVRRNHLPWAWGGGGGECDERIGRFCLTYGASDDTPWRPPPEEPEVVRARERLIGQLHEAAQRLPGDAWVAGQRARYLLEARRTDEARLATRQCRSAAWWCSALAGFVHHYAGEPREADSAFSASLAQMPPETRREWTDLSHLLEGSSYRFYRRLDEGARVSFAERFWFLGDPFYMRPGNELRSEHLSRNVWNLLQDRARSTEGISWGDDLREILLRYGWPAGWERVRPRPHAFGDPPSLVSHYADSDRNLIPPPEVLAGDADLSGGVWDAESERARTGYAVPLADSMARWLETLDHQFATFRRGDSALVVAAYELPADSFPAGAAIDAALALLHGSAERPRVVPLPDAGARGVMAAAAPAGSLLLSLELLSEEASRAARARRGVAVPPLVPGLPALSDLLLLREPDSLPDSLPDAMENARGSTRLRPGERIAVYWEVYGLRPEQTEALTLSLRLQRRNEGWMRRLGKSIGLVDRAPPVRVRWQEQRTGTSVLPRSLALQLPDDLDPGDYALELSLALPEREELMVQRLVRVEPNG